MPLQLPEQSCPLLNLTSVHVRSDSTSTSRTTHTASSSFQNIPVLGPFTTSDLPGTRSPVPLQVALSSLSPTVRFTVVNVMYSVYTGKYPECVQTRKNL